MHPAKKQARCNEISVKQKKTQACLERNRSDMKRKYHTIDSPQKAKNMKHTKN